jgi:GDPmannose 4,6-dehydratase
LQEEDRKLFLYYSDLTDTLGLNNLIAKIRPDEVYNLAAQSHVGVSFEIPEYTANVDALGTLRLLESIKQNNLIDKTRFYQASTSELYGLVQEVPQTEKTPFYPRSPYGVAKLYSYWITVNYREAYGIYACNGILFNHESPRRGKNFVSQKVTDTAAKIFHGKEKCLYIGNLDAQRDWGHAKDYVEMQWLMLQQEEAIDYVIATGQMRSVRTLIEKVFEMIGVEIAWEGKDLKEIGVIKQTMKGCPSHLSKGDVVVRVDEKYFRPSEVEELLGDSSYAKKKLGWTPKISFEELIEEMLQASINEYK